MAAKDLHPPHQWTLFTNHGHVLISISRNPDQPLRDVAHEVGITERAVQRIVAELEEADFIERRREGRQNHYTIHPKAHLRHPLEAATTLEDFLKPFQLGSAKKELNGRLPAPKS